MVKLLKKLFSGENGQALPIVLCLLAIGGLIVTVSLNYGTTILKGSGISAEDMRGVYAAAAGVENVLWSLGSGGTPPTALAQNINQMTVDMQTVVGNQQTLYLDNLVTGVHSDVYHISSNITLVGGTTYDYTITITTDAGAYNNKKLLELGALLPPGYAYVVGSAASHHATNLSATGNPSLDDPNSTGYDVIGSQWVKWLWATGQGATVTKSSTYTQKFQISGTGSTWGSYGWMIGQSSDIGTVGQITGNPTTITATARRLEDGKITAKINAEVIVGSGGLYIFSWQVTK